MWMEGLINKKLYTLKSYPSVHISATLYLFIVVDKLWTTNNPPTKIVSGLFLLLGDVLLSRDPAVQVPSALEGLTVVFGMGTRGTPPPSPPNSIGYSQYEVQGLNLEN